MNINIDFSKVIGPIKRMNAVNNGPIAARADQVRSNFDTYKALEIPFARNHDASFESAYGGDFTVDVNAIFPDFSKDENNPANYDFGCTDKIVRETFEAGTEVYYRLGSKIEQEVVKHNTKPPEDFGKWARICAHIIRHYNYSWADGFEYGIRYWEIWNEPDGWENEPFELHQTWGGTRKQFFEFYELVAKYLKAEFPELKIGGPAVGCTEEWADDFLCAMASRNVPIDFFSWHCYACDPYKVAKRGERYKQMLIKYGYTETESHCNEWAYVKGWTADWIYTLKNITGLKGAAYTAAVMQDCQNSSIDMLMYYDARPCVMNGLFDFISLEPLKTYYVFEAWRDLRKLGNQVETASDDSSVFVTGARDENGKGAVLITHYQDDDSVSENKHISVKFSENVKNCSIEIIDSSHNLSKFVSFSGSCAEFELSPNTVALLRTDI